MTTPTDRPNLADLSALDKTATPGPWHEPHEDGLGCVHIGNYGWVCSAQNAPEYDVDSAQGMADAEFIAHSRDALPALVAALTDVLALADRGRDRGHSPECSQGSAPCERCAKAAGARELRRAITNHVTPDALASEATETKG